MNVDEIELLLKNKFPKAEQVQVKSEDNRHFDVQVVSDDFIDIKPISRQRMIYDALGDNITNGNIHAVSLKTLTVAEWKN